MARFIALFLICIAFSAKVSCAYEFEQINRLFSYLETNYSESLNYAQLTHSAGKILHDFDPNIKLYQSDSKAFLYGEGNLIDTFSFPDENKPEAWYSVFHKILLSGYEHSQTIQNNPHAFEQKVLTMVTKHLDAYSRLEAIAFSENLIDYTIKDNVLYISNPVFKEYKEYGEYYIKEYVSNGLSRLYRDGAVKITGLPSCGRVRVRIRGKEFYVVHLLYAPVLKRGDAFVLEDMPDIYNVRVSVRIEEKIKGVRLMPQNEKLDYCVKNGRCEFVVEKFSCHQLIVIDIE